MTERLLEALTTAMRDAEAATVPCPDLFDRVRGGVRRRRRRRQFVLGSVSACAVAAAIVVVPSLPGVASPDHNPQTRHLSAASLSPAPVDDACSTGAPPEQSDAPEHSLYGTISHFWGDRVDSVAICLDARHVSPKPL
jgi:hypothetical protein